MQKFRNSVSQLILSCAALLFGLILLCGAPQKAEAGYFEAGVGFGYAGLVDSDSDADLNGFNFSINFGYRILDWVGVYIDQDLGGLVVKNDNDYANDGKDLVHFYGATIFKAKFAFTVIDALELSASVGIGAVYIAWDEPKEVEDYLDLGTFSAFGLRLGIGATYYFTQMLGVGLNFDYTPSFDDDHVFHFLRFQLHVGLRF